MRFEAAFYLGFIVLTVILSFSSSTAKAAQGTCAPPTADWMIVNDPLAAPVRPEPCARVEQTPPDFSWPDQGSRVRYEFTLTYPTGEIKRTTTPNNWISWSEVLPPGEYRWQVRVVGKLGVASVQSSPRQFIVSDTAQPFVVPDWRILYANASSKPRPRTFPGKADILRALLDERRAGLAGLINSVNAHLHDPLPSEPKTDSKGEIMEDVHDEEKRTENAAFACLTTGKEIYFAEAVRRAMNMAAWNPHGSTGVASEDLSAAAIVQTLTLAYDWLYPRLDIRQRQALLASIKVRMGDLFDYIIVQRRINAHPFESHDSDILDKIAAMSAVLAGDIPEDKRWFSVLVPLSVHWTSPWGGEDGGFGNGTAYAVVVVGSSVLGWNILRWTTGLDLSKKAWVRNYARFLVYFLPPGSPTGTFGDAAEAYQPEFWSRYAKAYALFVQSPLARWYASQLFGEDPSRLDLLLAQRDSFEPTRFPSGMPDGVLFPSIGWTAMHSNLQDRGRTSIYFKSSPYGSWNHSHADQNSFVINSKGRALAIDSGYYDSYHSPHWENWYTRTIAHNAITFDGGKGQLHYDKGATGTIVHFEHHAEFDAVTGDATKAYGNILLKAQRSLIYLRPNLILVYDRLVSADPHQWEWNIHALKQMREIDRQHVVIENDGVSLCVDMLHAPAMNFHQTDQFNEAPRGKNMPNEWHGAFSTTSKSTSAEYVALLRVDCVADKATLQAVRDGWDVTIDNKLIQLQNDHIAVTNTSGH